MPRRQQILSETPAPAGLLSVTVCCTDNCWSPRQKSKAAQSQSTRMARGERAGSTSDAAAGTGAGNGRSSRRRAISYCAMQSTSSEPICGVALFFIHVFSCLKISQSTSVESLPSSHRGCSGC